MRPRIRPQGNAPSLVLLSSFVRPALSAVEGSLLLILLSTAHSPPGECALVAHSCPPSSQRGLRPVPSAAEGSNPAADMHASERKRTHSSLPGRPRPAQGAFVARPLAVALRQAQGCLARARWAHLTRGCGLSRAQPRGSRSKRGGVRVGTGPPPRGRISAKCAVWCGVAWVWCRPATAAKQHPRIPRRECAPRRSLWTRRMIRGF